MSAWVLILWGMYVPAFEAGYYTTYERCEAAGVVQSFGLRDSYGPGKLYWTCKQQDNFRMGKD